ncbi:hypothetical protein [Sphingomonas sp. 3-13AW]|uniref:hypothetical protein n=1 Tax=Sphingomonas sp. 3-13AW TaxID=3050450 RepID=UPI003BB66B18
MSRNLSITRNVLPAEVRTSLDLLLQERLPALLRHALEAARDADAGMTSTPQHHLYDVLEGLYARNAQEMPNLKAAVRSLYMKTLARADAQTVQTCIVREALGLASYIASGGTSTQIASRVGSLCGAITELRQGPLLRRIRQRELLRAA